MIEFTEDRQRVLVNSARKQDELTNDLTGGALVIWRGTTVAFDLGIFYGRDAENLQIVNIAAYSQIQITLRDYSERTGAEYLVGVASAAEFNPLLTAATWEDGSAQHVSIPFTFDDTDLDLQGANSRDFWLVVSAVVNNEAGNRLTLGAGKLTVLEDGSLPDEAAAPPIGGNIIPQGSTYDGSGEFSLAVTADKYYHWTKGANDTEITNGAETVAEAGNFITQDAVITFIGTPNEPVTAFLRGNVFLTIEESDARYRGAMAKINNDPGVMIGVVSPGGNKIRFIGVDDDGNPIDTVENVVNPTS